LHQDQLTLMPQVLRGDRLEDRHASWLHARPITTVGLTRADVSAPDHESPQRPQRLVRVHHKLSRRLAGGRRGGRPHAVRAGLRLPERGGRHGPGRQGRPWPVPADAERTFGLAYVLICWRRLIKVVLEPKGGWPHLLERPDRFGGVRMPQSIRQFSASTPPLPITRARGRLRLRRGARGMNRGEGIVSGLAPVAGNG
jgi:hypothetical protein